MLICIIKKLSKKLLFAALPLAILAVFFIPHKDSVANTGLVAEWKFDENAGIIAADSSGNGNNGTINGAVWAIGRIGSALSFDGADDYVSIPIVSSLDLSNTDFTIEAWIKPAAINTMGIYSHGLNSVNKTGLALFLSSAGKVDVRLGNGVNYLVLSSNAPYTANVWYHISLVYSGSNVKIYINGTKDDNEGTITRPLSLLPYNKIGKIYDPSGYLFNGLIDEVRIYNRALSALEILADYQAGIPVPSPPPLPHSSSNVSSGDGLSLSLSDTTSQIDSININDAPVPILSAGGGFSVKEIANNAVINLEGSLTKNSDQSFTQKIQASDIDFVFTYIPRDKYIEVNGNMKNLRNDDRSIQLTYALPFNALGWNWGDYARDQKTINGIIHYENVYKIGDTRTQNMYPFSSIDNTVSGLSIAVPMDNPRIYRIGYYATNGYSIQYDFGFSSNTVKIGPSSASFKFIIYKNDEPKWGFRGALKKYYEIYPQFFEKRTNVEGFGIIGDRFSVANIPNVSDFGIAFDWAGTKNYLADEKYNILSFAYSEPWGAWFNMGSESLQPSYDSLVSILKSYLNDSNTIWHGVPISEAAAAVLNTAPIDENGKYYLLKPGLFTSWAPNTWFQNYPVLPDPDFPLPNRFEISYQHELTNYINSISAKNNFIDYWSFNPIYGTWDSTIFHSGKRAAKIASAAETVEATWINNEKIKALPNTNYNFSAWIKNEGAIKIKPAIRLVERDKDFNFISQSSLLVDSSDSDWVQKKMTLKTNAATVYLEIYANIYKGVGAGWFDDVILTREGYGENLVLNPGFEDNARGYKTASDIDGAIFDTLNAGRKENYWKGYKWGEIEDYEKKHWNYTDSPLVFDYETKKPVLLELFAQYEYLDNVSKAMHGAGKLMWANIFGAYDKYIHLLDISGAEVWDNEPDWHSSYVRALNYQKTISNLMRRNDKTNSVTNQEMADYMKKEAFYAVYPGIHDESSTGPYFNNPTLYERDRPLFKLYIPIIKTISAAGWEPIPYALSSNSNIWLERYGYWDKGNLHYALRNETSSSQTGSITIDLTKIGASGASSVQAKNLITGSITTLNVSNSQAVIPVSLNSGDTLVFQINSVIAPPPVSADLNQDGIVNSVDFGILMSYWNSASRPKADLNQDGIVNSVDFGIMMSKWGVF